MTNNLKKKIAFIFSGEIRCNPLNHNCNNRKESIKSSYANYIFTDKFKDNYDYDVFISTDDLNLTNTYNFFGPNLKNVHLFDTNFYSEEIESNIPKIAYYLEKYNSINFLNFNKYDNSIHQYYKLFDAYNLCKNYQKKNNISYDFIVRSRLDTEYDNNLIGCIEYLEQNKNCKLLGVWDIFAIGKNDIMDIYCSCIDKNYGNYFNPERKNFNNSIISCSNYCNLLNNDSYIYTWRFAPEIQLFECLFEYCDKNNLLIDETINTCLKTINCHIIR
jgi:hypothetical protein